MPTIAKLLSREDFKKLVFERDGNKCIICKEMAVDAHHIIERSLFKDGGYYLDNGASLCSVHHLEAEKTTLSCKEIRDICNISNKIYPEHFYEDTEYDKWGNEVLDNGFRLRGELFFDENVQKILSEGEVLDKFIKWIKYPRTYHLPWSNGKSSDDKTMNSTEQFVNNNVVVTIKMDGENTTMYNDHIHARSISSGGAPWRSRAKQIWSTICSDIPEGWRICCENLQAKHSIMYDNLTSYVAVFSIWNEKNICLSWNDTVEWCNLLGLHTVPVIYSGVWSEKEIKNISLDEDKQEGYVVRISDSFRYKDFSKFCGKFVRNNHITSSDHWTSEEMIENKLEQII